MKVLIGGLIFLGVCVVIAVVEYFRGEKKLSFPKCYRADLGHFDPMF